MALSAATIFEVRNNAGASLTGSDNNGGIFVEGTVVATDGTATLATSAAPVFSTVTYSFVAGDVGAWLYLSAGTGNQYGWYKITAVNAGAATVNATALQAFPPYNVQGINSAASPTGISWAVDYSQQNSAQATGTVTSASTTVTATSGIFTKAMIGNGIGDGTQRRQITGFTSSTIITVDAAPSWTAATVQVGGALQTTQAVFGSGQLVAGQSMYATGSESRSTALTTIATGIRLSGYGSARLDGGKYTYTLSAGMGTFLTGSSVSLFENLKFNGNSQTITATFISMGVWALRNIEVTGVSGTNTVLSVSGFVRQVWIHDNASSGTMLICPMCEEIEIDNNASVSTSVMTFGGSAGQISKFLFYNNGGDGIRSTGTSVVQISDGVIYGQAANGINDTASAASLSGLSLDRVIINNCLKAVAQTNNATQKFKVRLYNCFQFNNTTASSVGNYEGPLTSLSGDPFINASGGNFGLNQSGANYPSLKAVGFTYPSGNTIDYGAAGGAQPNIQTAMVARIQRYDLWRPNYPQIRRPAIISGGNSTLYVPMRVTRQIPLVRNIPQVRRVFPPSNTQNLFLNRTQRVYIPRPYFQRTRGLTIATQVVTNNILFKRTRLVPAVKTVPMPMRRTFPGSVPAVATQGVFVRRIVVV